MCGRAPSVKRLTLLTVSPCASWLSSNGHVVLRSYSRLRSCPWFCIPFSTWWRIFGASDQSAAFACSALNGTFSPVGRCMYIALFILPARAWQVHRLLCALRQLQKRTCGRACSANRRSPPIECCIMCIALDRGSARDARPFGPCRFTAATRLRVLRFAQSTLSASSRSKRDAPALPRHRGWCCTELRRIPEMGP